MENPTQMVANKKKTVSADTTASRQKVFHLLKKGVKHQRNGKHEFARACYQDVLEAVPDQPDALNLLGALENEMGNYGKAIPLISHAIQFEPAQPSFFSNLGNAFRGIGRIQKAISCYRKSISLSPEFYHAHYNLAVLYRQLGCLKEAEAALREALDKNPNLSEALYLLGDILSGNGDIDGSITCYEKVVSINPKFEKAWFFAGNGYMRKKIYEEAESCYRRALEVNPKFVECLNNLGLIYAQTGKPTESMGCFDKALHYQPSFAEAHYNLGNVLYTLGYREKATSSYLSALESRPEYFEPTFGMGRLYHENGDAEHALQWYKKALTIKSDNWKVIEQIGNVKRMSGNIAGAIQCYDRALELNPNAFSVYISMGNAFRKTKQMERAASVLKRALKIEPESLIALNNMAVALTDIGKSEEAVSLYEKMLAIDDSFSTRIKKTMTLPVIYPSTNAMVKWRQAFAHELERLLKTGKHIENPYREIGISNFMLALHGFDERPIREMIANFYLSVCPQLAWTSPKLKKRRQNIKIKLGMVSRFLHDHTIGRLYSGIIEKLDKNRFDLFIFRFEHRDDVVSRTIDRCAKEVTVLPSDIFRARERIADAELDILFYPEIGMDPLTYFIGFSRLAPVQCKRGFQITMGIPAIDYFISSDAPEPPGAQQYYSEHLVRLKGTGYYYHRPERPTEEPDRALFGLPENKTLYICTQSLFKLHPDFDPVLAAILEKDPQAVLILLEGMHPHWKDLLVRRFETNFPGIIDRIQFVPRQPRDRFMSLHLLADAVVDTIYFSGGNTSLECFAWGIPVVTWPSDLLPGRLTYGFYKLMGLMDCVAWNQESYVDIAYRLAHDSIWRNEISDKIKKRSAVLFENIEDVRELESFFEQGVAAAYDGKPSQWNRQKRKIDQVG